MSPSIEITTHTLLRDLLRDRPTIATWHHYLTMGRLVARGLNLSASTLIQVGIATHRQEGKYRLSYLIPALLWPQAVTIAIPHAVRSRLVERELPELQQWLGTDKPIYAGDLPPEPEFRGLWLVDLREWLRWQLQKRERAASMEIVIDGAEDIEDWAQALLTVKLPLAEWELWRASQPTQLADRIVALKIHLSELLWQRPSNPYNCYLLEAKERQAIASLLISCRANLPANWQQFDRELNQPNRIVWAEIDKQRGTFSLAITPIDLVAELSPIWQRQTAILIASAVDLTAQAIGYRQELGLGELTAVKFPLDRYRDSLQLYMPRWMPMPNTSTYQSALATEIQNLLHQHDRNGGGFAVILIQDTPLKAQLAATIAAEWGSRVKVDRTDLARSNILVCGWNFWLQHQDDLPEPELMAIATLPIPSLEDPLVAARVNFYKQQKQDWFRLYLLPTGLRILHRAIAPMRSTSGIVAIFDNRIDRRIYGQQVLAALEPYQRIDRLEPQRDSA